MTVPQPNDQPVKRNLNRLAGILLLIIAAALSYHSIVVPLQQAAAHADKIDWNDEFAFLGPLMAMGSIPIILFPNISGQNFLMKSKDKLGVAGWLLIVALLGLSAGCYYLVDHQLESMGYVDGQQTPGSK